MIVDRSNRDPDTRMATRTRSCSRSAKHSQNLATAIRDSVCQALDPFSQSREPTRTLLIPGRINSIDFNHTPPSSGPPVSEY